MLERELTTLTFAENFNKMRHQDAACRGGKLRTEKSIMHLASVSHCIGYRYSYSTHIQVYDVHSSSAKSTVAAQCWPGSLDHSLADSSQCWMLLLAWYSRQGGQNMWLHFSVTFTGWKFRKGSGSVSVLWRTVVIYTAPHRRISPRSCNWHPTFSQRRHLRSAATSTLVIRSTFRSTVNTRWPSVLCGCRTCLEHSSVFDESCSVTYNVPVATSKQYWLDLTLLSIV